MGCSWFSAVSLAVLILASILANMKVNTETSVPETAVKHHHTSVDTTELPTISSAEVEQRTSDYNVTMKTANLPGNCSLNSVGQLQNSSIDEQNSSETKRCIDFMTTPVAFEGTSTSNESGQENVNLKRTYRDFPEYKHYKNLDVSSVYVTTIPGFITNPITLLIAMKIKPRFSCELYMIALACADLLTVTGRFVHRLMDKFVDNRHSWDCKLIWYSSTVGQVYSNLILMSWTLERFIAVMFPMKLAAWCSIRNTKITLILLLIFCLACSVPYITEHEAVSIWNGKTFVNFCSLSQLIYVLWVHIESVYFIYIPVVVVGVCNMMILLRLNSMTKARINMASNKETINKKTQENKRMTILLLSISATFLFLHIPFILAMVISYLYSDITVLLLEDPHLFAKILLYLSLCHMLAEFQNCINFFLYCLSGSKFRATFRKLFCKCIVGKQTPLNTLQSSRTDITNI